MCALRVVTSDEKQMAPRFCSLYDVSQSVPCVAKQSNRDSEFRDAKWRGAAILIQLKRGCASVSHAPSITDQSNYLKPSLIYAESL